jgi:type IX secretion system PorP/SprF family membrane protein
MKKVVFILFASLMAALGFTQDMQYSQYYSAPLYLNPAFTGANACMRVAGNIRTQWPGAGKGYVSQIASFDHFDVDRSIGLGVMLTNDRAGSGNLRTTGVTGSFAYEAVFHRRFAMRAGLQAGYFNRGVDMDKLVFGDQITNGGAASNEQLRASVNYTDFNTGILGYSKDYWFGFSAHHLFQPEQTLISGSAPLFRKYSFHGGKRFYLNNGEDRPDDENTWMVMPTFNFRHQHKFDQLDIGVYVAKQMITFGLWYRGLPVFKGYEKGYPNNDALAVLVGMNQDRFHIGYSYDFTISWLTMRSFGAHELSVAYQACTPKKKKITKSFLP